MTERGKIAKALAKIRNEKGLTHAKVLLKTGIHIGRIEMATQDIKISTLSTLCNFYGIKLSDFFIKINR